MINLKIQTPGKEIKLKRNDFSWWQLNRNQVEINNLALYFNDTFLCSVTSDIYFLGLKQITINFTEPKELIGIGLPSENPNEMDVMWFYTLDGSFYEKEKRSFESCGFFFHKNP